MKRGQAWRLKTLEHARLEPLALNVSCHEGIVNGWAAVSGEEIVDFVGRNHLAWRILK